MTGTYVTIAADGSVGIAMDLYYEEMGMHSILLNSDRKLTSILNLQFLGRLYQMETERIVNSAKEHNFYSHKRIVHSFNYTTDSLTFCYRIGFSLFSRSRTHCCQC